HVVITGHNRIGDLTCDRMLVLRQDDVTWCKTLLWIDLLNMHTAARRIDRRNYVCLYRTLAIGMRRDTAALKDGRRSVAGTDGTLNDGIIRCNRYGLHRLWMTGDEIDRIAFLIEYGIAAGCITGTAAYL